MTAARLALLTVLGLGYLRASGTWASAATVVLALGALAGGAAATTINIMLVGVAVVSSAACVIGGRWAERHFGLKDPRQVVADEAAGQAVALLGLPWAAAGDPGSWPRNLVLAGSAFAAFRLFDIVKPPPIGNVQRIGGGWGILLDDLLAGVAAAAAAHAVAWLILPAVLPAA